MALARLHAVRGLVQVFFSLLKSSALLIPVINRFWWRDVKIAELAKAQPPPSSSSRPPHFSHPHTLQPVQYFPDLQDITLLQNSIIPIARSGTTLNIPLAPSDVPDDNILVNHCESDGILFYVGESSYEPGSSLLAAWVPLVPFKADEESPLEVFARLVQGITNVPAPMY
jgi:snurportin-1